ncbi:MAG: alpha/beta fold hydrolase [Candidatus Obscuribacterales bacterium]|nr:alpha/beta fold hydrolase [Candidatus Obscuribacterales bacterium]
MTAKTKLEAHFCRALAVLLISSSITLFATNTKDTIAAETSANADAFDDVQSKAYVLQMDGKHAEAQKLVEDALKSEKKEAQRVKLSYLLAAIERMEEDYGPAIKQLEFVLNSPEAKGSQMQQALIYKRLADCYWGERNAAMASKYYNASLQMANFLPPNHILRVSLLESLTGTNVFQKKYDEAEVLAKKLVALTSERAKSNQISDIADLFWARIQLMSILRSQGPAKEAERKALSGQFLTLIDQLLSLRAQMDAEDRLGEWEALKQDFEKNYIAQFNPESPAEYLWLVSEFKMRTMPLINWPSKVPNPKAAILCIHGLGLENRSFDNFGHEMQKRGYSVYALDVRGFGSWLTTQGQEDLHFSETLKDIGSMVNLIKQREHNLPVFLLGESMGGAIALRGAALYEDSLAGVISSVPSAERFQGKRMGLSVAAHLLGGGKNRPFRVGDMVTAQATKNEALAEKWKSDAKAKMDMSPKELIKFAVFMRSTKGECEKIKTLPVFVIQGLKDRLVKPEGTVALFDAVQSADKNLFIIGTAEHLIFETFVPSPMLLDTLTTWIDDHARAPRVQQSKDDSLGVK